MSAPARQPAGTPVGGRFAPGRRPESTATLDAPSAPFSDLTPEEAFTAANETARYWASRCGVDADDVAQDALLAYLVARANRVAAVENGEQVALGQDGKVVGFDGGYLNAATRSAAIARLTNGARSEDRHAYAEFRARRSAVEQDEHRTMSRSEEDALAETIRMNQPATRRARAGYHRRSDPVSLDAFSEDPADDSTGYADRLMQQAAGRDAPVNGDDFTDGSSGARAEQMLVQGGKAAHVAARKLAWDAVAEVADAPRVRVASLTERRAAATRKTIIDAGGVASVVEAWENGEASAEQQEALFAPFGGSGIAPADKEQVARLLGAHRAYAEDLWDSSVLAATVTRRK